MTTMRTLESGVSGGAIWRGKRDGGCSGEQHRQDGPCPPSPAPQDQVSSLIAWALPVVFPAQEGLSGTTLP